MQNLHCANTLATQENSMKTYLITTALAAGLALPAIAQDAPASPFQTEAMGPSVSASELIGARIYASETAIDADAYAGVQEGWNDIGEVNDVILGRDGTVDAVLVDIGGFLGMGERKVAVDMAALRFVQDDATDVDDWFLVLQADRATLDQAPEWVIPGADTSADATDASKDGMENIPAVNEALPETTEAAPEVAPEAADDTAMTSNETAADGTLAVPDGYATVAPDALTAELLTGADVHDASDASIAEVSDLVLSPEGQVTDVVLDVGGFLGIGAKTVAIPLDRLTVAQTESGAVRLWVNMTKDDLKALPDHTM
jgi:PRC-barrel domain